MTPDLARSMALAAVFCAVLSGISIAIAVGVLW